MKNIWLCLIPTLIICGVLLISIIVLCVKHTKKNLIWAFVFLLCVLVLIYFMLPYVQDLHSNKVETFEGVYTSYSSVGSDHLFFCSKNIFESDELSQHVYISNFQFSKYDLEKGKKYKIVYYKSSHAVHSIESID